ncbi:MAG: hypothetical protein ACYCXN_05225 [Acidimicrobiales bacterium]|jgi:hypothetical protein
MTGCSEGIVFASMKMDVEALTNAVLGPAALCRHQGWRRGR